MGAGLYDAAFSTIGSLNGSRSRSAISAVTLFGGFASTVCWPLSAFLALMGRLALPLLVAMAVAPLAGGIAFQNAGADGILVLLTSLAVANVVLVTLLGLTVHKNGVGYC